MELPAQVEDEVIVLVHGGSGGTAAWAEPFAAELAGSGVDVIVYDWTDISDVAFIDAGEGINRGEDIAAQLAERSYSRVHLVGHSVGSFVVHGVALGSQDRSYELHSTFLDPFQWFSVADVGYGHRWFGWGTDAADSYFVTSDGVPSTQEPLERAFNVNLDALAPDGDASEIHFFPTDWYRASAGTGLGMDLADLAAPGWGEDGDVLEL